MNEKISKRITERLTEIIKSYSGREPYSDSNLRLGGMVEWPGKQVWMVMYDIPLHGSSRTLILEHLQEGQYMVSGRNLSWVERAPKIRLEDQESAFKEFEQRVMEIPEDIKNIFV